MMLVLCARKFVLVISTLDQLSRIQDTVHVADISEPILLVGQVVLEFSIGPYYHVFFAKPFIVLFSDHDMLVTLVWALP